MRAADCHCGQHLEGTDDEELLRLARAHVDTDHPEAELTDEQIRELVLPGAYDVSAGPKLPEKRNGQPPFWPDKRPALGTASS